MHFTLTHSPSLQIRCTTGTKRDSIVKQNFIFVRYNETMQYCRLLGDGYPSRNAEEHCDFLVL